MPDADAPVFGLSMSQISCRVDGMARVAGLGDGYSSHSGRVGLAVKGGDKTCQRGGDKLYTASDYVPLNCSAKMST